jgi:hypothetical protein
MRPILGTRVFQFLNVEYFHKGAPTRPSLRLTIGAETAERAVAVVASEWTKGS